MALSEAIVGLEETTAANNKTVFGELCWFGLIFCDRLLPTIGEFGEHMGVIVRPEEGDQPSCLDFHYQENDTPFLSIRMGKEHDPMFKLKEIEKNEWMTVITQTEKEDIRMALVLRAVDETVQDEFFALVGLGNRELTVRSEHGIIFTLHWDSMAFGHTTPIGEINETLH
jgi:hypothetical protein